MTTELTIENFRSREDMRGGDSSSRNSKNHLLLLNVLCKMTTELTFVNFYQSQRPARPRCCTEIRCNTLQHVATRCNTLQHICCQSRHSTRRRCNTDIWAAHRKSRVSAIHCNTLRHTCRHAQHNGIATLTSDQPITHHKPSICEFVRLHTRKIGPRQLVEILKSQLTTKFTM